MDADRGTLIWSFRPKPLERLILNNGRLIPFWPIRTGVLVRGGTAYFAASLLPWKESYLCAVDAGTGKATGGEHFIKRIDNVSFEGALLASDEHLVAPQGRVSPLIYRRTSGKLLGGLKGGGGCFVMLTPDAGILHGPGNKAGWITDSRQSDRSTYATYKDGNAMVIDGDTAYMLTDTALSAMSRSTKQAKWAIDCEFPHSLVKAGGALYTGGWTSWPRSIPRRENSFGKLPSPAACTAWPSRTARCTRARIRVVFIVSGPPPPSRSPRLAKQTASQPERVLRSSRSVR